MKYQVTFEKPVYFGPEDVVRVVEGQPIPKDILAKYRQKLINIGAIPADDVKPTPTKSKKTPKEE